MKTLILALLLIFNVTLFAQTESFTKTAGVTISLPWVNNFSYYDYDKISSSNKWGFGGLGLSLFYKKNKNKFSLNYDIISDAPAPIGALDYGPEGTRTAISAQFVEAMLHHTVYKKFNAIGGINYSTYHFDFISHVSGTPSYTRNDPTLGLTVGAEYIFTKHFSLTAFYRPAIYSFKTKDYKHTISLDARFDINIWKK